jgi:DHA2 family multidrug resistance protein-like MFS transporter
MMDAALPSGLSPDAVQASRSTLGGAVATAAQLPGELGPALIDAARDAFMRGLRLTAAISVIGSIVLAIFAGLTLRRVRRGSTHPAPTPAEEPSGPPAMAGTP